ncbi:Oligopeptide transport ATP-binding protein oppF (plasmid) [Roseomonas mucosa]|uniref:hypothetical protein n=1 Tax=Roseomonas TaxID=125216 RepID=UPI0009661E03|nr:MULTISPECIES: hypothetical protein [Roseomonas]MDT8264834.1 hypothetical protein [Roseomonas sp. DSM 102946]MDT8278173.1 hypothetical protein [Roseomonas mucosa]USQ73876.1 hypothetical protein NF552_21500 [Roseomonas mucosa]UZO99042.1 Oligopeptide transport ATP-binding protein oppF [Roseomonas mucosa]GAV33518.1 glutamine transport ATP-binding protein GlnQ [Roseomonas sp. TAS13]
MIFAAVAPGGLVTLYLGLSLVLWVEFFRLRALLLDPVLLFADEAISRLDPVTQQEVIGLLQETVTEHGMALLMVTHEDALAEKVARRIVRLNQPQMPQAALHAAMARAAA